MSPISIALNLLLAGLLMATLLFGWVLNRRLKALKDSHAGFAAAVEHLDRAAERAEAGLADLRTATDQAVDLLTSRILKARELADSLDRLTAQGAAVLDRRGPDRPAPPTPRAIAERIAAERGRAEPTPVRRPAQHEAESFGMTTEDEALAAAEALILKLSQSEVLTTAAPRHAAPRPEPRPEPRLVSRAAPGLGPARHQPPEPPEPVEAPRAQAAAPAPKPNPRSRAHVDDDLFEGPARGRLRAFDGGLA
jgi:hypothetical protein